MLSSGKYIEITGDKEKEIMTQSKYGSINNVPFFADICNVSEETKLIINTPELNKLLERIVSNIYTVHRAWKALRRSIKILANDCVNPGVRETALNTQKNCNQIVNQLFKDLHRVREIVRIGDKQQQLHVEKLTNNFRDAVEEYHRIEKEVMEHMKMAFHTKKRKKSYDTFEDEYNHNEETARAYKQLITLELSLEFENALLLECAEGMREMEMEIIDLDQIISELNELAPKQIQRTQETNEEFCVELGEQDIEKNIQPKLFRNKEFMLFSGIGVVVLVMGLGIVVVLFG